MATNNQEALTALAATLGIDSLTFNSDHVCEILFDDEAVVTLEGRPDESHLRINGLVGDLEDSDSAEALRTLLHANFNGQGVGNASLGMDHVSNEVVLGQTVDVAAIGAAGLAKVLEAFVNYLMYWRENLRQVTAGAGGTGLAGHPTGGIHV